VQIIYRIVVAVVVVVCAVAEAERCLTVIDWSAESSLSWWRRTSLTTASHCYC